MHLINYDCSHNVSVRPKLASLLSLRASVYARAKCDHIYLINTAELISACTRTAAKEFEYALGARREKAITTHSAWLDVLNY